MRRHTIPDLHSLHCPVRQEINDALVPVIMTGIIEPRYTGGKNEPNIDGAMTWIVA
jgi:hypothetical protein